MYVWLEIVHVALWTLKQLRNITLGEKNIRNFQSVMDPNVELKLSYGRRLKSWRNFWMFYDYIWCISYSPCVSAVNLCKWEKWQSQGPSGLRPGSVAARLLWLRFRIPPGTWKSLSRECCVLSGRGLSDGPITRPEESYWLWPVIVPNLETFKNEAALACVGLTRQRKKKMVGVGGRGCGN